MVLSTDVEILPAESRVLMAPRPETAAEREAKRQQLEVLPVPIAISIVRTCLEEFEDESFRRLLLRYAGNDVLPNGWRTGPESNGIQVLYGDVAGTSWPTMRTTCKLYVSAERAAGVVVPATMVPKFDDMTKEVRVLERLSDATEIRLASCRAVMFTSPRDFCVATSVRREPTGRILVATRSVEHPNGQQSGYVRALSMISGYVITPHPVDPNICEISVLAHMDLGGNLPAMVIRYLGLSAPIKMVDKIREVSHTLA